MHLPIGKSVPTNLYYFFYVTYHDAPIKIIEITWDIKLPDRIFQRGIFKRSQYFSIDTYFP